MSDLTLSVVSHGQMHLVSSLLEDLATYCGKTSLSVILTLNCPEELPAAVNLLPFPVKVIRNAVIMGFGENHNRAFLYAKSPYFCVINPDIRIKSDFFKTLLDQLGNPAVGLVAPLIVNGEGVVEDSARKFPTPLKILCKLFRGCRKQDYQLGGVPLEPDWVGGMFMVFRSETYERFGGFDKKFFLYYEDVDLCARIRLQGLDVVMIPSVQAIHLARRSSHTSAVYSRMHIQSMFRFFMSIVFLKVMWRRVR